MRTTRCPWHDEWLGPEAPEVLKPPLQMLLLVDEALDVFERFATA